MRGSFSESEFVCKRRKPRPEETNSIQVFVTCKLQLQFIIYIVIQFLNTYLISKSDSIYDPKKL